MNILIPHHWLLEHLDSKITPRKLAEYLSLCGPSVEKIETIEAEPVYDIEVTTNRVDAMSVRGIAREAAVILPEFNLKAGLKPLKLSLPKSNKKLDFTIKNDPSLCHRILAIKLENVNLGPSPDWMQKRLKQVGQRPLLNAIDITNYVMWEIGHPVHVFDYDRLTEKTIIVREAKKGEQITTLDGQTHTLVGGEVVFDDGTGTIVDLPGIMGTRNTVVTGKTRNILLWIESVVAPKIRFASMTHALRSQAAVLNEKQVDPELGLDAIKRGVELLTQVTSGQVASQLVDIYPHPPEIKPTTLNQSRVDTYLGTRLSIQKITRILTGLGCQIAHRENTYQITPPSFRAKDLQIPQDYIEEIARIHGYHNLESQIMATPIPDTPKDSDFRLEHQVKQWLAGWGASEIYTYSMVSADQAAASGFSLSDHFKLENPYSKDWVYLRRSLVPSLKEVFTNNPTHRTTIFELQNIYPPQDQPPFKKLPQETLTLAVVTNRSFSHLKGLLDALAAKLHADYSVRPLAPNPTPYLKNHVGDVVAGQTRLGYIGRLQGDLPLYAFELSFPQVRQVARKHPHYLPVVDQAPIIEDMTFTLPSKTYLGPVIQTIKKTSTVIENVALKTVYRQNYTFTIIYRRPDRPLTDQEIAPIRQKIVDVLGKETINLVGSLEV